MINPMNNFEWAHKLECPPSACTDPVKKTLCKGILELLWSEIGNAAFTNKEVREVRKNILLYKLRHRTKDASIECIRNVSHLKAERKMLKALSTSLKEEYRQQDFLVRQRVEHLENIKSKYSLAKIKKDLLKIKHNEINTLLHDSNNMRLICQNLMPPNSEELDRNILQQSLDAITTLGFGATKREVKSKISNLLKHIKVPVLWTQLYQGLCQDVENLIKVRNMDKLENSNIDSHSTEHLNMDGEDIDIGIARLCGQHICMVSRKVYFKRKAKEYKEEVMKYIENIETSTGNQSDLNEWLFLLLEVKKLEAEERTLENEIKAIRLEGDSDASALELQQLLSEIRTIDSEIEKSVEHVQRSLLLLKSAECVITNMKQKLHTECMNLLALRADNSNFEWLNKTLNSELQIFYDELDIKTLRKVILQGEIRAVRHDTCSLKEASVLLTSIKTPNIMPYFPMIQAPIYCLIDCYKNLITNYTYQRVEVPSTVEENDLPVFIENNNDYNVMEFLMSAKRNCDRAQEEIDAFNVALSAWSNQTVQEVMALVDKTVDDLSFPEWIQRYTLLLYMIDSASNK